MSIKNYPYIGLFTNNPYDIRGLEFIELYKNDKEKLYKNNTLRYKYYKLLEDHRSFILKLYETSEDDPNNPFLQKWLFDFFSRFINFDAYKNFNVFVNYESSFNVIKQIIEEIKLNNLDFKEKIEKFIEFDKKELPTNFDLLEQQEEITELISQIADYIETILLEFDKFYNDENETSIKLIEKPTLIDLERPWNNFNIDIDFSLDSTFTHKSFDLNFKKSIQHALDINSNLNKKYELYFKLQKYNNNIKSNIYFDTARFNQIDYTLEHCLNLFLNIDKESCDILFANAMAENGYGPNCKALFENDEHFIIWERITYFKKLNRVNIKYIMKMLDKLQFKIKVKNLKHNPKIISIPDSNAVKKDIIIKSKENKKIPTYVRFYENFDSWRKHQTISKKLNNQPNLKEYLNTCIDIINRRITYLNPNYKDFYDFGNNYFNKIINTNDNNKKIKIIYKKILQLFKSDDVELDQVIINLQKNKQNLKSIFTENNNVIDYNYLNNIGLIMTMLNNPSENNITQLSYLLNNSYKFNKALFEF